MKLIKTLQFYVDWYRTKRETRKILKKLEFYVFTLTKDKEV